MSKTGMLYVYSGPSGVGKGTILGPYLKAHENAVLSVSATTRAPRPGETEGVEYHFLSAEQFENLIENGGLLEYAQYSGNYYGTPRAEVEKHLMEGLDVFLEIEVQGAMKIKKTFPDAVFIFVLPPSFEVLQRRLTNRGTEPPAVVEIRLNTAREEMRHAMEYDYVIINDNVENAREELSCIVTAAKCQTKNMKKLIQKVSD